MHAHAQGTEGHLGNRQRAERFDNRGNPRKQARPEKFDKRYANCKIPTIDDIFAVIPKDKSFELEIKTYGDGFADKVEAARKKAGLGYKNILITSFAPAVIKDFKEKYPQYETLLIVSCPQKGKLAAKEIIKKAKYAKASQVAIGNYKKLDRAYIKEIQDAGFKVGLWQVENLNDLAIAAKLGADTVINIKHERHSAGAYSLWIVCTEAITSTGTAVAKP